MDAQRSISKFLEVVNSGVREEQVITPLLALQAVKKEPTMKDSRWRLEARADKKQNPSKTLAEPIASLAS